MNSTVCYAPLRRDKPCCKGLLVENAAFPDAVRDAALFFVEATGIARDDRLPSMAKELIARKAERLDPRRLRDRCAETLRELIDAKVRHRQPDHLETDGLSCGAKIIDLVEALARSFVAKKPGSHRSSRTHRGAG